MAVIVRNSSHSDYWDVDFENDMSGSPVETLTGGTFSDPTGTLTIGSPFVVDGDATSTALRATITGGTHGKDYQIKVTATTSSSRTLVHIWNYRVFN